MAKPPSDPWNSAVWSSSCFESVRPWTDRFASFDRWPMPQELEAGWFRESLVLSADGLPLRVIPQPVRSRRPRIRLRSDLYDFRVVAGEIPTRGGCWHDFFNLAMFAAFPKAKAALHARHKRILMERIPESFDRLPGARTREQDALALLDEGGIVLATSPSDFERVEGALLAQDWAFLSESRSKGRIRPWVLGHAILEHEARSMLGHTAQSPRALVVAVPLAQGLEASEGRLSEVDYGLSQRILDRSFLAVPPAWPGSPLGCWFSS